MAHVRATTLYVVAESRNAAAWVFSEEISWATTAAAASL
jgi:hypothetical protein